MLSDLNELVFSCTETDFFRVLKAALPFGIGVIEMEYIVVMVGVAELFNVVVQTAAGNGGHLVAQVCTCLIESDRVKGGEHTNIGNDGDVVFTVAVAVG